MDLFFFRVDEEVGVVEVGVGVDGLGKLVLDEGFCRFFIHLGRYLLS